MDVMVFNAGQREQEVRDLKREIADMLRHIQRLNGELEALLRKVRVTHRNTPKIQACWFQFYSSNYPSELSPSGRLPAEGNQWGEGRRRRQPGQDSRRHRPARGGPEAGQAGSGWTDPWIPRADEPQDGPGHRDRHLPQAAGGRRAEVWTQLGLILCFQMKRCINTLTSLSPVSIKNEQPHALCR